LSTSNIISIEPDPVEVLGVPSVVVTFQTHTQGQLSYRYTGYAAIAIMGGADPAEFFGSPA
jgi:hypothetical protein